MGDRQKVLTTSGIFASTEEDRGGYVSSLMSKPGTPALGSGRYSALAGGSLVSQTRDNFCGDAARDLAEGASRSADRLPAFQGAGCEEARCVRRTHRPSTVPYRILSRDFRHGPHQTKQ